jgi:uncharacterized protein (DUF934 family)
MSRLITKPLGGTPTISEDALHVVRDDSALPAGGDCVVSLTRWKQERDALLPLAQAGRLGVFLQPEDNPEDLEQDARLLPRIAYEFPVFKFGQGYSDAYLLRKRYGFKGHLRAFGDIWRDQLFYLARVGFDEFLIKEGKSVEDALNGFGDFTEVYQDSVDIDQPLFRRRHATADSNRGTA